MQTLSFLLALLFLVAQTPAQPTGEGEKGGTIQEPEATEAQDTAAVLMAAGAADGDDSDTKQLDTTFCRCRVSCNILEKYSGKCELSGRTARICCRKIK
uniref:Defensin-A1 n=3 Tax=Ornithorhynchus anatinus TaxID=9258 RepID=DEFA1_ORNAN|nr:RecName: Full=Defensin-A1; Short=DefA1; Short=OaDefA1; Flags: Precursor [Ornithorhynchus anatinus]